MKELQDALEKMKSNHRTNEQLAEMPTSELLSRGAIFSVEIAGFAAQAREVEDEKEIDPEMYVMFTEMVDTMSKNLLANSAEIDRRFPVPR